MWVPTVAFWVLIGWSLYDGELYPKEAAVFVGIWLATLAAFMLLNIAPMWFVIPTVLLDIVLIFKLFGGNINVR
jgi:hypothetical protein